MSDLLKFHLDLAADQIAAALMLHASETGCFPHLVINTQMVNGKVKVTIKEVKDSNEANCIGQ